MPIFAVSGHFAWTNPLDHGRTLRLDNRGARLTNAAHRLGYSQVQDKSNSDPAAKEAVV